MILTSSEFENAVNECQKILVFYYISIYIKTYGKPMYLQFIEY